MAIRSKTFILTIFLLGTSTLMAQESVIKDYVAGRDGNLRSFCFYSSTLRMLNLDRNPDFDELASSIEKLLIYSLDSSAIASKDYVDVIKKYESEGYEEYAAMWGGTTLFIYGSEDPHSLVGVFGNEETAAAFYLSGKIAVEKIPSLINSLQENQLLNLFDLTEQRISRMNITDD